jgi:hypothetical protein
VGGGVDLQVEHETRFELAIHTWPDGQPFVLGSMTRKYAHDDVDHKKFIAIRRSSDPESVGRIP